MIKIEGGMWVQLTVGGIPDSSFIRSADELLEFTVVEQAGNALPEFILSFITFNEKIYPLLHEGTAIKVTYGKDGDSLKEVVCFPGLLKSTVEGTSDSVISINGLCVNQAYITDNNFKFHDKMSSIETVIAVAKARFKVDTNIEKSNDSQVWIQPSITDKAFISKTIMHADITNGFPATAITADGKFIIRDIVKLVRDGKPKWSFVSEQKGSKDIKLTPDGALETNSTFINNWTGYSKITKVLDLISNTISDVKTSFKPILSMSKVSDAMSDVKYRYKGFKVQSDAVHTNYWSAQDKNLVNLSQMSKVTATHTVNDFYFAAQPLDLAFIKQYGNDQSTSSDYTSGLYLVTKVSRTIQGKQFATTLAFNRESVNGIKNLGRA